MSRESKIFNASRFTVQEEIKHYESFGWELLSINKGEVSMTRETQNPVYAQLVKYEYEYEDLCNQLVSLKGQLTNSHFKFKLFLLLFILFIFPSVIYICSLVNRKKKNEMINKEIEDTKKKIQQVCDDSRALFFGKQA